MTSNIEQSVAEFLIGEEYDGLPDLVKLGKKAIPELTRILTEDKDPFMRQRAAIALGRIRTRDSVDALTNALTDEEPPVVISVIDSLTRIGQKKTANNITACLKSADPSVRRSAVIALGKLGVKSTIDSLIEIAENEDEEDYIRDAGINALSQIEQH